MTQALFNDPAEAANFAVYRAAQVAEYGAWVAAQDIPIEGVLAFAAGHPVPADHVARFGWDTLGLVVPAGNDVDPEAQMRARLNALDAERASIEAQLTAGSQPAAADPANTTKPARARRAPKQS